MAFYDELDEAINGAPESDYLTVGADSNGHAGQDRKGFERVHGGRGFGIRNQDRERIVDMAEAHDLATASTFFMKRESQKVTYCSGGQKSEIDHILDKIRKWQMTLADAGLRLNLKKTEIMSSIEEPGDVPDISGTLFTQTKEFQYLGSFLSADGTYYASKETPPSDHLTTSLSRAESVQNAPGFTSIAVEGRDKQLSQKILSYN
ncbi:hypothetical protein ANCCEY_11008 [Ancylostoma ceylanicum]|uniref:Reverse transcriptase domain-containing protein n=1 Tax=Ancylostoma ceylanicum TaxID=53326 RepID=A0A0D6LDE6_9BILA|nr:hypothetical protein ANCCEY_11008 [Ancylostoma ceylanicum]